MLKIDFFSIFFILSFKLICFANKNEAHKYYIGKIFTDKTELMKYIRYLYKNNE